MRKKVRSLSINETWRMARPTLAKIDAALGKKRRPINTTPTPVSKIQKLEDAFKGGNTIEILETFLLFGRENLNSDQGAKSKIKNIIRGLMEEGKIEPAVGLAKLCFECGVNYERNLHDITTTETLICAAQKKCPVLAAELTREVLKLGLAIRPQTVTSTLVLLGDNLTSIEDIRVYADLTLDLLDRESFTQPSAQGFCNVVLAKLGDPTGKRDLGDRDIFDTLERMLLGSQVAFKVIEKGVCFTEEENVERMNMFIRGIRTVSSDLRDQGLLEKSDLLMKLALKLTLESIGKYEIKPVTVITTLAAFNRLKLEPDNYMCNLIEKVVMKALDSDDSGRYLWKETLDICTQNILNSESDRSPISALVIASEALKHGVKFNPITLRRVRDNLEQMTESDKLNDDLNERKEILLKALTSQEMHDKKLTSRHQNNRFERTPTNYVSQGLFTALLAETKAGREMLEKFGMLNSTMHV